MNKVIAAATHKAYMSLLLCFISNNVTSQPIRTFAWMLLCCELGHVVLLHLLRYVYVTALFICTLLHCIFLFLKVSKKRTKLKGKGTNYMSIVIVSSVIN